MGYIKNEKGQLAWETTELNCPQTAEGECICEDGKEEVTIFDKADQIVEAAANIDAAGGDSTLLDLAYGMPEVVNGGFPLEPVTDTPDDVYERHDTHYSIYFANLQRGDILKFYMPFRYIDTLDDRLIPYIKKVIICSRVLYDEDLASTLDYHTDAHRAFLVTEGMEDAVRLHGVYRYEVLPNEPLIGRQLSKREDLDAYSLTGFVDDLKTGTKYMDAFLNAIPYSFLKRAYIADCGIYLEYKICNRKTDTTQITKGTSAPIQIHFPKNEIIKAIEEEMKGK